MRVPNERWTLLAPLLIGALVFSIPASGQEVQTGLAKRSFEKTIQRTVRARYLFYLPREYNLTPKKWPLLLYLHGGTGRGTDLEKIMWYPVPNLLQQNPSFPFVVVAPQCPEGAMWTDTEMLISLLDQVMNEYSIDPDRVYLVGYSMGGHGAWYLAYHHPERFAAVAPMSGMSNPWWATRLKDVPLWAFHGADDDRVPVKETEEMVEALKKAGGNVKVTIVPGRGHQPPSPEEHDALFEWLLKHRISERYGKK